MKTKTHTVGLGGGCHWCTEAVFQSLIGVEKVEQGFIASTEENKTFSEAVIVHYNPASISIDQLIEIHLETHKSSSNHSMRNKYRSAIYTFSTKQQEDIENRLTQFQETSEQKIITQVLPFGEFKASEEMFQNYYRTNPEKPFCKTYIDPKIALLLEKFSGSVKKERIYS
ncbi:MAG: peptide-methionine (S)-S-oxide reductase [Flavobacteriaceae bacterium]